MNAMPKDSSLAAVLETGASNTSVQAQTRIIRRLIWLYVILWLIEGGLRRWVLPGLQSPLLLVRDPVVIAIYGLALSKGLFPSNGFIYSAAALAFLTFCNALLLGHGNPWVALYGVRCDFLHLPLIFIIGQVFRERDILAFAKAAVWLAMPYTALLVAQFYEPQTAWINRGVGGDMDGAGFSGALDRFRPPGTFSFISGPSELYPLLTACWFVILIVKPLPMWLMMGSGLAILTAIPVSISRSLFLSVVLVSMAGISTMIMGKRLSMGMAVKFALISLVISLAGTQLPAFKDGMEAFSARWQDSTMNEGGFEVSIVDRVVQDLIGSFDEVSGSGLGTGFSTNVGQKMLTQHVGFGASESEWGRLLFDNGVVLGGLMIIYRVALASFIVLVSVRAWRGGSLLSLIFASSAFMLLLNGQWGQATTLGSSVICGGVTLSAGNSWRKSTKLLA
jgi:hypothetical protein